MDALHGIAGTSWGKWLGFVTAVWVQCISGNNYTFSNYSDAIKTLMGLTQLQLNGLSVAKDIGKAFGILAGLASDKLPTPVILLIGSVEGLLGYGAQWLVVSKTIKPLPYWQMCVVLCMGGNSTTWMNTAVLVTCMRNFRRNRGPVSGILKGYVGLSTAIFTDICSALFADDPASFLLMLSIVPAVVCGFAMLFLRESLKSGEVQDEESDRIDGRCFAAINTLAVAIAVYLLGFDLTGLSSNKYVSKVFVAVLSIFLLSPASVPIYLAITGKKKKSELDVEAPLLISQDNTETAATTEAAAAVAEQAVELDKVKKRPEIGEDHTIVEAVKTTEFWVLFVSFLCGVGTGLAVMNNLGQMGVAMGYSDVSIFVSMTSIWGFFGRIGSGTISEHFIKKNGLPRPIWNAASQILMAIGYVVMALALPGSLFIGSIVVGICYGVRLAVSVPTASELFGLKYYGLIYNILILNLPLGSFLFSGLLAGLLYDSQATKTPDGGNTCVGAHCYRLVFIIMSFACLVGFGLDLLLSYRTRTLYLKIQASKRSQRPLK
ncbi:Major facilitator superfamily protein [Rhynchospora pubera]|uniref:Major facilitator superfamily protein n=1 Tax=Rhynchospora pubera TaxID=906938 RepID=A0AAV8E7D1_9POAL|nr:Major facilitator superfamily protein [Rhynchospora pubera]